MLLLFVRLDLGESPSAVIFQLQEVLVIFHQLHAMRDGNERRTELLRSTIQMFLDVR